MTSRAQGGCRILTNVHNGSSSLSPLPLQTDFCQWFIATTYSPFASWSSRYGERKILSWRTALIPRPWWFDTSPPVSWYLAPDYLISCFLVCVDWIIFALPAGFTFSLHILSAQKKVQYLRDSGMKFGGNICYWYWDAAQPVVFWWWYFPHVIKKGDKYNCKEGYILSD